MKMLLAAAVLTALACSSVGSGSAEAKEPDSVLDVTCYAFSDGWRHCVDAVAKPGSKVYVQYKQGMCATIEARARVGGNVDHDQRLYRGDGSGGLVYSNTGSKTVPLSVDLMNDCPNTYDKNAVVHVFAGK
ncbi:hypothetical protein [Nocardia heshunensis]